jgi:CheY-like chemotaxis protein
MENIRARSSDVASNKPDKTPIRDLDKTVLIVEDNRINMLLTERMIKDAYPSISIHKAFDGVEALRTLEGGLNPDIILMDLQMPLMDGFETTRRIRATKGNDIRIIALTASAVSQIRDQCLEVGMNDFLSKPFTREQLAAVLQPAPGSQDRTSVEMTAGAPAH